MQFGDHLADPFLADNQDMLIILQNTLEPGRSANKQSGLRYIKFLLYIIKAFQ